MLDYYITRDAIGIINGANRLFKTPAPYRAGTLRVLHNGQFLTDGQWEEVDPFTFRMLNAPVNDDQIMAHFKPMI